MRLVEKKAEILVVEDDRVILDTLAYNLSRAGYSVNKATTGAEALKLARSRRPDLILLDIMLPGESGTNVCRRIREEDEEVVIVMVTAKDAERDKVKGFEVGADDYVTKPFGMDELLARLRAAVRRAAPAEQAVVVRTKAFTVDLAAKKAVRNGTDVRLTPTEWHILELLVRNPGRLVGQREILREVWGPTYEKETNYLRVYLAQLRRKLEPDPAHPRHLITEPGMGYRFEP